MATARRLCTATANASHCEANKLPLPHFQPFAMHPHQHAQFGFAPAETAMADTKAMCDGIQRYPFEPHSEEWDHKGVLVTGIASRPGNTDAAYNGFEFTRDQLVAITKTAPMQLPVLLEHDSKKQVGRVIEFWISEKGYLWAQLLINPTSRSALEALGGMKMGFVTGLSLADSYDKKTYEETNLVFKQCLCEISIVKTPDDPEALIYNVAASDRSDVLSHAVEWWNTRYALQRYCDANDMPCTDDLLDECFRNGDKWAEFRALAPPVEPPRDAPSENADATMATNTNGAEEAAATGESSGDGTETKEQRMHSAMMAAVHGITMQIAAMGDDGHGGA